MKRVVGSTVEQPERDVWIRLLGRFEVRAGDEVVIDDAWGRRKAKALLKCLALQAGHALHRDQILDLLWPDLDPAAAANSLYKNLHYLRAAWNGRSEPVPILGLTEERVTLHPSVKVDVDAFCQAAERARRDRDEPSGYATALAVYEGSLLPGDLYEEWALQPRRELSTLWLQLLLELGCLHERRDELELAIERFEQLASTDPAQEEAHVALMRLFIATGRRHRGFRQYQICREALERNLGVSPSPETEALYRRMLEASRVPAASAPTESRPRRIANPRPSRPLFGRETVLAQVEPWLRLARQGRGQVILIGGPAGIGKSHLARHIVEEGAARGALLLAGRSYEMEAPTAYQPFRDLLRHLDEQAANYQVATMLRNSLYLERLLPDAEPTPLSADPAALQAELFREMARLVRSLAASRPLMLLLEDLHAADEASLRLFHFLSREIQGHSVSIVATFRAEESAQGPHLAPVLASLRREGLIHEVTLGRLDEAAMRELVAQRFNMLQVAPDLLSEVVGHGEGNPFLTTELIATLIDEGRVGLVDGEWRWRHSGPLPVPGPILDLLDRRLRQTSESARQLLPLLAVLGRHFDYWPLPGLVPLPESTILDALDDCIAAGFIEETDDGYSFHHGLIREAVYRRLSRARRQQLHRQVATSLEVDPEMVEADPERVAYHFARSDVPRKAIPFLVAAARRAMAVFANVPSVEFLEEAVRLARDFPSRAEAAVLPELLEELGDLQNRLGNTRRALAAHQEALAGLPEPPDPEVRGRLQGKVALSHIIQGNLGEATEQLQNTVRDITALRPDIGLPWVYYSLAQLRWHKSENREALEAAEAAVKAAECDRDTRQLARAYEAMALACHSLGDWQRGVEFELKRQTLAIDGYDVDAAFDAHLCLWEFHLYGDRPYAEVEQSIRNALRQAEGLGNRRASALCHHALGAVQYVRGDWRESRESLRRSLELGRSAGSLFGEIISAQRLALVETGLGKTDLAYDRLQYALGQALGAESVVIQAHSLTRLYATLTYNRFQVGDLDQAHAYLDVGIEVQDRYGECVTCGSMLYPSAVPVQLSLGQIDQAEQSCRQVDRTAGAFQGKAHTATARFLRGLLAIARCDWRAAQGYLDGALSTFTRLEQPFDRARCFDALAEVADYLPSAYSPVDAAAFRQQAASIYARLGYQPAVVRFLA